GATTTATVKTLPVSPATKGTTTRETTVAVEPGPSGPAIKPSPATTDKPEPPPPDTPTTELVDLEPPTVTITAAPRPESANGDASFSFHASDSGAALSCRFDQGAFEPCASPVAYHALAPGPHSFAVRARDAAGNTGPAAVFGWTVLPPPDTTPPTVTIVSVLTA